MKAINRKATPKVTAGQVRKKNNWSQTPNYYNAPQRFPVVDRRRPGAGFRHILSQRDIHDFIAIVPDWNEMAGGLNGIVLAPGDWNTAGYHVPGVVHVCAWERELWTNATAEFFEEHRALFERLGVPCECNSSGGDIVCQFTAATVRAYQLLHILLHELGHHHDRMTTRSQVRACRGETYAEAYALKYEARMWQRYQETFGLL